MDEHARTMKGTYLNICTYIYIYIVAALGNPFVTDNEAVAMPRVTTAARQPPHIITIITIITMITGITTITAITAIIVSAWLQTFLRHFQDIPVFVGSLVEYWSREVHEK